MKARALSILCVLVPLVLEACEEKSPPAAPTSRFASVKADAKPAADAAAAKWCDTTLPASGAGAKTFAFGAERPINGYTGTEGPEGTWRWVNLWATWCKPCVEEMPLLGKWKAALEKDGRPLELDLVSIDEDEAALTNWVAKKPMPGHVRWIADGGLPPLLATLGVDPNSAIPIHALVDPAGQLRCVRVGSVREGDFAAVRALLGLN